MSTKSSLLFQLDAAVYGRRRNQAVLTVDKKMSPLIVNIMGMEWTPSELGHGTGACFRALSLKCCGNKIKNVTEIVSKFQR